MPASEAQVRANQANALKSTGPKTEEGKERSRANSYKHGLTGAGVVMPQREAAEVARRSAAFEEELAPSGEVGLALVRMAATLSVRVERCVEQENAALTARVRRALVDFVPPEDADEDEADRLRAEAGKIALFDPSKEATLARKYEAEARRGFFRALKELRQVEDEADLAEGLQDDEPDQDELGSISENDLSDAEFDELYAEPAHGPPRMPAGRASFEADSTLGGRLDVPISAGRGR